MGIHGLERMARKTAGDGRFKPNLHFIVHGKSLTEFTCFCGQIAV